MKNIFAACLLIIYFSGWSDCPKALSGSWFGFYTDNGPFQASIPIELKLTTRGNTFSGHTVPDEHSLSLNKMPLQGTCTPKTIEFYLSQDPSDPKPSASHLRFVNINEISIDLYWRNAMIGGSGPALLEREKSS